LSRGFFRRSSFAAGIIHSGPVKKYHLNNQLDFSGGPIAMARILIRCPTFNKAVPTGLTTNKIKLDSLDLTLSLVCPACGIVHEWKQTDAWVEREQDE
jgi:hypothetical protein